MATGNVENWTGEIAQIGAAYPFVGMETVLVIAGVVFWLWWHVAQLKAEKRELQEQVERYGDPERMREILDTKRS